MVPAATLVHSIDLRLLGPVVAHVDGRSAALGGPRQMGVLARLMLTPGQTVSMDQLVDSVWDGDEPARPQVAVRSYVSNLRRAIEPHRQRRASDSCIASSPPGYMLDVDPEAVDWVRFERLIHAGRDHVAAGEYASAIAGFRDALSLWRGEPCTGLSGSELFIAYRSQFVQMRETAHELLFDAQLARGDHLLVVDAIEAVIAENPLRERLTELAMIAFYRAGRQTEALALGQRLRARLRDQMGIDPGPQVADVEVKILNHDKSLNRPARRAGASALLRRQPSSPPPVTGPFVPDPVDPPQLPPRGPAGGSEVGVGRAEGREPGDDDGWTAFELDLRTTAEFPAGIGSESAAADASPIPPSTLPTVGREGELTRLGAIAGNLAGGRSSTAIVAGEPGIGKTTLVRELATHLTEAGIPVAWSRCVENENTPFWVWAQAVVSLMETSVGRPSSERWAGLEPLRALGPSAVAALGLPPSDEADDLRYGNAEILLAITQLMQRVAKTTPIVLVFEDLHWADRQSISLLRFAASTLTEFPIGFVLTWSPTDSTGESLSAELRNLARLPALIRIDLAGLDAQATMELARHAGHHLSTAQVADLQHRCGGSPLFLCELLTGEPHHATEGVYHRRPNLSDTVLARTDRLHPQATQVLGVAALFRVPFSVEQLAPLCGLTIHDAQDIVHAAVRGAVLEEVESRCGWYRYRYPLMAEVLVDELLTAEQAARHSAIGHHLLSLDGPSYEAAHHLGNGRSDADRRLAAEIALGLFDRDPDCARLADIDRLVGQILAGATDGRGELPAALWTDAHLYTSWRAWLDRRGDEWRNAAGQAINGALQLVEASSADGSVVASGGAAGDPIDRLGRSALGLVGFPAHHPGPVNDPFVDTWSVETMAELNRVANRLPIDHAAHWVVQMQLAHLREMAAGPATAASQAKAIREAKRIAAGARKKVTAGDLGTVLYVLLNRYGDRLDPTYRLDLVAEIGGRADDLGRELFLTRISYPALVALGRRIEAETEIQAVWIRARTIGDQVHVAEARALRILHLLWVGRLDEAGHQIERGIAEWKALGLVGSAAFGHQLYHWRRLCGLSTDPDGSVERNLPLAERADRPARLALLLAELGQIDRGREYLDRALEAMSTRPAFGSDLAELAGAAGILGHQEAGMAARDALAPLGDRLILSPCQFVIAGPASLFAGIAASAVDPPEVASVMLSNALKTVQQNGGSTEAIKTLLGPIQNRISLDGFSN